MKKQRNARDGGRHVMQEARRETESNKGKQTKKKGSKRRNSP